MSVIPRFLTRLPLTDCSFDVDFNSAGDVGVTIPDGYYWCLGTQVSCKANTATATVAVASGGDAFAPGDVVTVWDVSAGAALATDATVVSATSGAVVIDTTVTTALGDVLYHSNDLIGTLQARIQSADISENSNEAYVTLRSSGVVQLGSDSGSVDYVITWGADGTTLRDRLQLSGSTTSVTSASPADGAGVVVGDFYPSKATVDERVPEERRRDAYETDNGSLRVFNVAQVKRTLVRVRFGGNWRTAATERTECLAFLNEAQQGYRVRYYPDVDVTDPWDESSTPWGYEEWVLLGPTTSDPDRVIEGKTNLWEVTLELQKWVG